MIIYKAANMISFVLNQEEFECHPTVPSILQRVVGKRYLFKIKVTEYNRRAIRHSFTVCQVLDPTILNDANTAKAIISAS